MRKRTAEEYLASVVLAQSAQGSAWGKMEEIVMSFKAIIL